MIDPPMNAATFSSNTAPIGKLARAYPGRNAMIAIAVVLLHVGFIWALQSGLLMRAAELIVPAEVIAQFVDTPAPKIERVPPAPPAPAEQKKVVRKIPVQQEAKPLAIADPTPSPNAPVGSISLPTPPAPEAAVATAPTATPAPPVIQLPSSDADYLRNPAPAYPPLSRRLGETGRVMLRVLIGADGQPKDVRIAQSSGYERLDQAAQETVRKWRFVPGTRNGVPTEMWNNVPINFVFK